MYWTFRNPPQVHWTYRTPQPETVKAQEPRQETAKIIEAKWTKVFDAVFDALRPHPQAREAALCVLDQFRDDPHLNPKNST